MQRRGLGAPKNTLVLRSRPVFRSTTPSVSLPNRPPSRNQVEGGKGTAAPEPPLWGHVSRPSAHETGVSQLAETSNESLPGFHHILLLYKFHLSP